MVVVPCLSIFATPLLKLSTSYILVVTPTPQKQKFIKLNQREKKATSEKLAHTFIPFFLLESFLIFSAGCCSKKQLFDKILDIDYWQLANNQFDKDVDLSFPGCQCFPVIKASKMW